MLGARCSLVSSYCEPPELTGGGSEGGLGSFQVQFGNEPLSERVHVVHAVGSVVNLLQEVFQLLDENTLLEPLH